MAMKEGTVSAWNKKVGDSVEKGEYIASINSEKIEMEIESPAEGVVLDIIVPEGQGVPPGTVICYIGQSGEKINDVERNLQAAKIETAVTVAEEKEPQQSSIQKIRKHKAKISPVARKMAEAAKLDIDKIQGTGPGGRITKEDVQKVMEESALNTREKMDENETKDRQVHNDHHIQRIPVSGMRKVIAERMLGSLQTSAQLTLTMKADVTDLLAIQNQVGERALKHYDVKLTVTDFIAQAVILSLKRHKEMNSAYIDDQIQVFDSIHLGIAVSLEKGLVVPVIHNAETASLIQLSKKAKDAARKARQGQLSTDELKGSTFTISNLGAYGIEHFTPILNPPETGILGIGSAYDTPIYKGEELQRRTILPLNLTFDHRVVDGAPAAEFLRTIKQYLEEPILLLFSGS